MAFSDQDARKLLGKRISVFDTIAGGSFVGELKRQDMLVSRGQPALHPWIVLVKQGDQRQIWEDRHDISEYKDAGFSD